MKKYLYQFKYIILYNIMFGSIVASLFLYFNYNSSALKIQLESANNLLKKKKKKKINGVIFYLNILKFI